MHFHICALPYIFYWREKPLTVATMTVFAFPPRLSFNSHVSTESPDAVKKHTATPHIMSTW